MLEHRGTVVTREQLRRRLWPDGTFVDYEHSLNAAVKRLRTALGDDADQPKFVETVPRRGYRLLVAQDARPAAITTRLVVSPRLRLAVLPFSNLSRDSNQDYFSDGLTEELIAQLGPLCRGDVGVIARWSTMVYKGSLQRAREIGVALQADYLLEGSTRSEGSRVRITARLVETASEADRWSGTYDLYGQRLAVGSGRRRRRCCAIARQGACSRCPFRERARRTPSGLRAGRSQLASPFQCPSLDRHTSPSPCSS